MSTTEHRAAMVEHLSSQINAAIAAKPKVELPKPGVYPGVGYDTYHAWPAANASMLRCFSLSPMHAREEMLFPSEPTEAKDRGHVFHMALLEPARFEQECVVGLGIDRRSNANKALWAEFEAEHRGHYILKQSELDDYKAMQRAVFAHPVCSKFLRARGLNEVSFLWNDIRLDTPCKAREDMLREVEEWPWCVNLKTARCASKPAFQRAIHEYGYHQAAAFYLDGLAALGQENVRFGFLVVEKERPYGCAVYELEEASIEQGRQEYREHLLRYIECLERDEWPGYAPELEIVGLPKWALKGWADGD